MSQKQIFHHLCRLQKYANKLENIGSRIDMQTHAGNGRR